jgi:cobaltochelatase CobN
VQAVAGLYELLEMNYVREHTLAVYASAWKDEKALSDIFVYWNGYISGKGVAGTEYHQNFVNSLKSVNVTNNKVVRDEYDLFVCCCYFGTHGGMTAASRHLSGFQMGP